MEIAPCLYCQGEAELIISNDGKHAFSQYICTICESAGPKIGTSKLDKLDDITAEAATAWNVIHGKVKT